MRGAWEAIIALLLAGLAVGWLALLPPSAAPASARATAFSAMRAFPDVRVVAQRPHPIGSADGARVRGYLLNRLSTMGLDPSVRPGPVANIVGRLPGSDPAEPAVVLMSHYDSTPHGPGAADDAAGVAAALEAVRALKASGPHRRDILVLITDGEEAGLLGARAFFGGDPLSRRAGVIVNLEARGNRGRAVMFQTHQDAGGLIGFLIRSGALHGASSLMPDLYRRLPNDTDLTEALKAGHRGLNFAFFGGQAAYHTAKDTPANLDRGSLQHMGEQALAAARALADAPALPGPAPDRVYADVLGGPVLAYPPGVGLGLVALALALTAFVHGRMRREITGLQVARGAAAFALLIGAEVVVLSAAGLLVAAGPAPFGVLLDRYSLLLSGYGLLSLGTALLVFAAVAQTLGRWRATAPDALWLGALYAAAAGAAALEIAAPLDAFLLTWPLLAATAAAACLRVVPCRPLGATAAGAVAVLALGQIVYWAGLAFALVGVAIPAVLAVFVALSALVAMPWAARAMAVRGGVIAAIVISAVGAGLLAVAAR